MENKTHGPVNPALRNLGRLVGKWNVELVFPHDPSNIVSGQASFDWLEGESFVVEHLGPSTWIMGLDDSNDNYYVLYHDDREVSRVYQMNLSASHWTIWRDSPGFSQRFEGRLDEDDNTIKAHWEKSSDGATWEHDFDIIYRRVG